MDRAGDNGGSSRTVVLSAGDFPAPGGRQDRILRSARRVVCCDSAADSYFEAFGREPDAVVGDCDSVRRVYANLVRIAEQDTNDLAKAISYCRRRGWNDLVVLGAVGKRDDHTLGNVFRALAEQVPVVTEYGVFRAVSGNASFVAAPGAGISPPVARMVSLLTRESRLPRSLARSVL